MGANSMKKILKNLKKEKEVIILIAMILFLTFNLVRATNQISELQLENQDLLETLDRYYPNEEENY